jgi:hypothetical protein
MTAFIDWIATTWAEFIAWCQLILERLLTFFTDSFLNIFELITDGVVYIFTLLEPPEFLTGGLGSLFSALPNDISYFLGQSGLAAGLAIYGAGITFRLLRKLFTLGQW